ncbi:MULTISPECIES: hypothetical protein [Bacillaceae]|nr:hypothetical protein [Bacillus sp. PK3_68]RJS58879.1 hypothetical protein CJ483_01390 [Bacillus sp. PK3_68]
MATYWIWFRKNWKEEKNSKAPGLLKSVGNLVKEPNLKNTAEIDLIENADCVVIDGPLTKVTPK